MAPSLSFSALAVAALAVSRTAAQGCAPQQIFINYGDLPTTMWVSWATTCKSDGVVSFGTSAALGSTQAADVTSYTIGSYTSPSLYHALLTGLTLNTKYFYSVGGAASGTSVTFNFTSHPEPSAPLTFGIIGDLGQTANSVDTLKHLLASKSAISSVIHVGDISYADGVQTRWDSWGVLAQPATSILPYHVGIGNHGEGGGGDGPLTRVLMGGGC